MKKTKYRTTRLACYVGYITQAIVVNLAPLFFVIFGKDFGISNSALATLLFISFLTQIMTDTFSVPLSVKYSPRSLAVWAHVFASAGLLLMAFTTISPVGAFPWLAVSMIVYSIGGGLTEVVISPIIDAIMVEELKDGKKTSAGELSILHSFYCWGQVLVVLFTTLLLLLLGTNRWFIIPAIWALIPFFNIFFFSAVPMPAFTPVSEKSPIRTLLSTRLFIVCMVIMVGAGAAEMSVSQWASLLAEKGLGVSKPVGDLLGPCAFAIFMGSGRILYGLFGSRLRLTRLLELSCITCIIGYTMVALCKNPALALLGCSVCGLSVSVMWPGGLTLAANKFRSFGAALFGILAVCGDVGCTIGPALTGYISDAVNTMALGRLPVFSGLDPEQIGLKVGLFICVLFPIIMLLCLKLFKIGSKKH